MSYCDELARGSTWRDVVCEFLGTFFMVTIQCALPLSWGTDSLGGVVQIALGMGFVVTALIETFGEFGGAQMNPAVTISMIVARKISCIKGFLYIIAQCAGSTGAAAFIFGVTPADEREGLATTTVNPKIHPAIGMVVEAWLTAILVFVIFGSTNKKRRSVFIPSHPIGLAVALDIMAGIKYTGSSMNPARSLGPAIMMSIWEHHWVYWVGPISGGIIATVVYHYVLDKMEEVKDEDENEAFVSAVTKMCAMKCVDTCQNSNEQLCHQVSAL